MNYLRRVRPWLLLFLRLNVGAIFLAAALTKIGRPLDFAVAMHGFRLLDASIILPLTFLLIWLELCCGLAVLAGLALRGAALLLLGMTLLFLIAVGSAHFRGLDIDCGCFGAFMHTGIGWWTIFRVLALLICNGLLYAGGGGAFGLDALAARRREAA